MSFSKLDLSANVHNGEHTSIYTPKISFKHLAIDDWTILALYFASFE